MLLVVELGLTVGNVVEVQIVGENEGSHVGNTDGDLVGVDRPVVGDTVGDVLDGNNIGDIDGLIVGDDDIKVDGAVVGDTDADVGTLDGI